MSFVFSLCGVVSEKAGDGAVVTGRQHSVEMCRRPRDRNEGNQ